MPHTTYGVLKAIRSHEISSPAVETEIDTGRPSPLDVDEPRRVAESVRTMGLRYATVTGVARDDLPDEGAWLYAETVRLIHELNPGTGVEVIPEVLQRFSERARFDELEWGHAAAPAKRDRTRTPPAGAVQQRRRAEHAKIGSVGVARIVGAIQRIPDSGH